MALVTRYYDHRQFPDLWWSWSSPPNVSPTFNTVPMTAITSNYISYNGRRTHWGELILEENPFTLYREKVTRGYASVKARNEDYKHYTNTWSFAPASVPLPDYAQYKRSLRESAWRELYGEVGELKSNLALIIAERQETVNMVNRGLRMIKDFTDAYRKRNWNEAFIAAGVRGPRGRSPDAKGGVKQVAQFHLWLNLGLMPIAQDVYALANKDLRPPTLRVAKSKSFSGTHVAIEGAESGTFSTEVGFKTRLTVSAKADIPSLDYFAANIAQQLGLTNPASLAWELMPYSFIVNWFVDIGSFLAQFDTFAGLRLIEMSETYTDEAVILGQTYKQSAFAGYPVETISGVLVRRSFGISKQKSRVLLYSPPIVTPRVPLLEGLNVGKLTTLLALVAQRKLT